MNLLKEDLIRVLQCLPKKVFDLMKTHGSSIMLAGGFIRACIAHEKLSDIDLFVNSKEQGELYAKLIADESDQIIVTDNAITVLGCGQLPIQIITHWVYEKPEYILPSFDFTIAKAIIWFAATSWQGICDDRFYMDLAAKRLVYCSPIRSEPKEIGGSLLRVLKFYHRGYRIPLDSLGAVISQLISGIQISKDDMECPAEKLYLVLRPNTESKYARIITNLLREIDPNTFELAIDAEINKVIE